MLAGNFISRRGAFVLLSFPISACMASFALPSVGVKFKSLSFGHSSIDLQGQHRPMSPPERLHHLTELCKDLNIDAIDVYGDFEKERNASYLRRFEGEVAEVFGKEDALFLPSGVMAQSIGLLIHGGSKAKDGCKQKYFACHHSSHLLLHEENAHKELLNFEPIVISTEAQVEQSANGVSVPPMRYTDVVSAFDAVRGGKSERVGDMGLVALIAELPHRELGGKLTPWQDVLRIAKLCEHENVRIHCDGARIFEASAGYGRSVYELSQPFDAVYISFYKGLGAISGGMLLGGAEFIKEARVWLRRFGGNLYTLLPYAVSSWAGFRRYVVAKHTLSFVDRRAKMIRLVQMLSGDEAVGEVVTFDPSVPETSMVHGYLRSSIRHCASAIDMVETKIGIRVLSRMREIEPISGYRTKFEWAIGDANGSIRDDLFLRGWQEFAAIIKSQ